MGPSAAIGARPPGDADAAAESGGLEAALARGHALFEQDRFEAALKQADIILASYPDDRRALALREDALLFIAIDAVNARDFAKAEALLKLILRDNPDQPRALRLLATVAVQHGVYKDAEALLEKMLALDPDCTAGRCELVNVLAERRRFERALEVLQPLLTRDPDNIDALLLHGMVMAKMGRAALAVDAYRRAIALKPGQARVHVNIGHSLKTLGHQQDAIDHYHAAIDAAPWLGEPWWSLANLKTYRFSDDDLAAMTSAEERALGSTDDQVHRCFALGKAYADRKNADRSMAFYLLGNASRRAGVDYSSGTITKMIDRVIEVFTPKLFAEHDGGGCRNDAPIFIIGLPRSGSTLIEQVLASHPLVDGTMELSDIIGIAGALSGKTYKSDRSRYPDVMRQIPPEELTRLGEQYIADTRIYRSDAPHFTDKMPNNFVHVGLIRMILPNAKVIDARRHPLDACFSGFRQLFARGQDFSYSLQEIGAYYRDYERVMDHFRDVLPGFVLRMHYEDVIDDFETQVRRILDHCGLPFDQACLDFHKNDRPVHTASSEQVRQPIYRSGQDQWRPYARYLGGLKSAIGQDVIDRYEAAIGRSISR